MFNTPEDAIIANNKNCEEKWKEFIAKFRPNKINNESDSGYIVAKSIYIRGYMDGVAFITDNATLSKIKKS